jgi:ribosomal protein S18 acetylase RimI-like enzyme
MRPVHIAVARPADWPAVARWTFAHLREPLASLRADHLVWLLAEGEIPPAGVLVATRDGDAAGGMVAQHLPGGTAVVLVPGGDSDAVQDALAEATVARFAAAGVTAAQAFIDEDERARAAVLTRHGFRLVTDILHLSLEVPTAVPLATAGPDVRLAPYAVADPVAFADTLLATYEDSPDVPEANAGRTAAEVLAGFRHGQPDPPNWWLATDPDGVPLGVLLLSADGTEAMEVAYLGVVSAARGRGVGGRLIGTAVNFAAAAGRSLHLSVDERNRPARHLYARHGLHSRQRQHVFLWNGADSTG